MKDYSNIRKNKIGHAREELKAISELLEVTHPDASEGINAIIDGLMYRCTSKPRRATAGKRTKITTDKVREIQDLIKSNPTMHNRRIGRLAGVDGGRVSEVQSGLRTLADPSMARTELTGKK